MLHRYLPKKSNLKEISDEQIKTIENKLNNRPRKCLGFKTPRETFNEQLSSFVARAFASKRWKTKAKY